MASCDTPDLGRIKSVGLFLLDDCMSPVYGTATGYIDTCPAALSASDDVDEGDDFKRTCADGSTKRFIPGVKSLNAVDVDVDLHWFDSEWLAAAGFVSPVMFDGEVVGWGAGKNDKANVLVVVTQEIEGGDVCSGDAGNCNDWVRMYPLKGARLTEDGDIGSQDNVFRLTGSTVDTAQLGSGPIPLFCDPETGDATWATDCFPTGIHKYQFSGAALPTECGSYDTTEPETPCTPAS